MSDIKLNDLKELINLYDFKENDNECFLSIIGKNYDECIVSKLVLYSLNNIEILKQLINRDDIVKIIKLGTELSIDSNNRIDIYFEGEFENKKKFLIIIENKIWSNVHDNQCKNYYERAKRCYKNYEIFCYFLKPSSNKAKPDDEHFQVITYDKIYELVGDSENIYISDFRKEIKNYLMKKEYSDIDFYFLKNLNKINGKVNELWKDINVFMKKLVEEFNYNNKYTFDSTYSNDHTFIRLYDKKEGWRSGDDCDLDNRYYFYFELYFSMNLNEIFIQKTIKRYSENNNSKLNIFIENKYKGFKRKNKKYYIVSKKEFIFDKDIALLSEERKNLFEIWFKENFKNAAEDMHNIFSEFVAFKLKNI